MPTYATADDALDYIEGLVIDDPAAFDRLIERAERDVDGILKGTPLDSGLRYDPAAAVGAPGYLMSWRWSALARAVVAQVEYRMTKGEDFFIHAQRARESGPDFSVEGRLPYIGPKVYQELSATSLPRGRLTSMPMVGTFGRPSCDEDDLPWPAA